MSILKFILLSLIIFMPTSHAGETWKIASLEWAPYAGSTIPSM